MNIFILDLDPRVAARYYCDRHVVKIILEIAQMLWTAWHLTGPEDWQSQVPEGLKIYRATHANHPMNIWIRTNPENFRWAVEHGLELCAEYTRRYSCRCKPRSLNCAVCSAKPRYQPKVHACQPILEWLSENIPPCDSSQAAKETTIYAETKPEKCTSIPLCISDRTHHTLDVVESYRNYYRNEKIPAGVAKWQYQELIPEWV